MPPPILFSFSGALFLVFFDLQLMEDIKDGKEKVLDEVVIKVFQKNTFSKKLKAEPTTHQPGGLFEQIQKDF